MAGGWVRKTRWETTMSNDTTNLVPSAMELQERIARLDRERKLLRSLYRTVVHYAGEEQAAERRARQYGRGQGERAGG